VVQIGLTPSNPSRPTAQFTFAPVSPTVADTVTFNASTSLDEGASCGANCAYAWDFGDGTSATGIIATKNFPTTGSRLVRLTVTDAGGATASSTQTVTVGAPAAPTVGTVTFGPTPVIVNRPVNFDAGAATVGAGATIESFTWVWGDGETSETSGPQTAHAYDETGTFTVRVTVRDNLGRTATSSPVSVTVTNPTP
jgi:PKD repeat protein